MTTRKCMTCGCDDLGNDHHYISDTQKCAYCIDKAQGPCWDGYQYAGTKDQNGKTVPNCIPAKKDIWGGAFSPFKKESVGAGRISGGIGYTIEFGTPDCQNGWSVLKGGTGQSIGCYLTKEEAEKQFKALANPDEPEIKVEGNPEQSDFDVEDLVQKKDKQDYTKIIPHRKGEPSDKELYARVLAAAKKKFKVYPSAVANAWVSQEYKKRGGTYKVEKSDQSQQDNQEGIGSLSVWNGSFAPVFGNQSKDLSWQSTYNSPPQKDGQPSAGYGNSSSPKGKSNS